ncbi:MAG: NFACT RNA binding domain-containing protein [Candidatus Latescibacterota bacterium]|nr:NFACT RNA binding domain-containing protein [Candidatus Latescibacterota bacterium]
MGFDYFTTSQLASELHDSLLDDVISGASFRGADLKLEIDQRGLICFQCKPNGLVLYYPNDTHSLPRPNKDDPVRYFVGARFIDIGMSGRDRGISFFLERFNKKRDETTRGVLVCEMMNRRIDCALISQETQLVLGGWGKEKRIVVGNPYIPPIKDPRIVLGIDSVNAKDSLVSLPGENYLELIRRTFSGIDRSVIREILYRCNLKEQDLVNPVGVKMFCDKATETFNTVGSLGGYIYEETGKLQFTAICPTRLYSLIKVDQSNLLIVSLVEYFNRQEIRDIYDSKEKEINQIINRTLSSLARKRIVLKNELMETECAQAIERKGHILLAHLEHVSNDTKSVSLVDVFEDTSEAMVHFRFNDSETPAEHAKILLKRAKKLKRRRTILPSLLSKLDSEIVDIELCRKSLDGHKPDLEKQRLWLIEKGYMDINKSYGPKKNKRTAPLVNPREYVTNDGWVILAGRNNKENDLLTHRTADQNDFWFHAHGYPGSHVILKRDGRKDEPSKTVIEQAAAVAAFWSKGKTAKKVPVVFTLKKYVNKPKGGVPGQAVLKREKTVIVQPGLPEQLDER